MRVLLLVAAVLVLLAGTQLFLFPERTADWFAWTVDPPMTAVFLGASYWSSAVLELSGARSQLWRKARLAVPAVFVFTALTLLVTLVHLDKFHLGAEHPASARAVTWGWLAIYAGVPVAMVIVGVVQERVTRAAGRLAPRRRAVPGGLRLLLAMITVVFVLTGVALLVSPVSVGSAWPWPLTPLTARAVGAWLVGLGWAAGHACLVDDAVAVRPVGLTGAAFVVLQAVALARHGDALAWDEPAAYAYLGGLLALAIASAWILSLGRRRRVTAGGAAEPGPPR